jgi:hypothetical protein
VKSGAALALPSTRVCTCASVSPVASRTPFCTSPQSVAVPLKNVAIWARVRLAPMRASVTSPLLKRVCSAANVSTPSAHTRLRIQRSFAPPIGGFMRRE